MRDYVQIAMFTVLFIATAFAASGCQTSRTRSFDGLRQGMTKAEVLDQAGGPDRSMRWQGMDRWIYVLRDDPAGPQVREVHFENGHAIYVGAQVLPKVSASDQDQRNRAANQQEDRRLEDEEQHRDVVMGKARPGVAPPNSSPEQEAAEQYINNGLYGTQDLNAEKTKRAPVFVPVDE